MGMPWSIDSSPERAHCWLSEEFSVPSASLCLNRPESPNSDYVCCAAKGHRGKCQYQWTGNNFPQFRPHSFKEARV